MSDLSFMLAIEKEKMDQVNAVLTDTANPVIGDLLEKVEKFGGPEKINEQAKKAEDPARLMDKLKRMDSPYVKDLEWLAEQKDKGAFVSFANYCDSLGVDPTGLNVENQVTLEISALQFFPWLMAQARQSIENKDLMPGRFIRVRNMAEQCADNGDIMATAWAMQLMGATWVECPDTRGTDGSNIHLGGPETITGYFGGIGQPNDHALLWLEEFLHYYTQYGVRQVLNINAGTVLLGYLLNKLGVDNEFKISVYLGTDNPYSVLWTLMCAKLFARKDNTTSLIGFNLANSVNNDTIFKAHLIREGLGLTDQVRFEHHIIETYKSIVIQPYNRRQELVEIAAKVPNISAKHEGTEPEIDARREHPTDILDYFLSKKEILEKNWWSYMEQNYLDKHHSVNLTAKALLTAGIGVVYAPNLH